MTDPLLRVRASGLGGSGYAIPTRNPDGSPRTENKGKTLIVPGVTTVLGALDKPGVVQWAVDNTAAYAVANASALAEREEDWGFRYLRFFHQRKPKYDDPEVDIHNYHTGVLNDLAEQGNIIHDSIEAFVKGTEGPEFARVEQEEAFIAFLEWADENEVEFIASEVTVLNLEKGFAGTLDLVIRYRGKIYLVDVKTSRKVHESHVSQVAALWHAPIRMEEDWSGVEYKGKLGGEPYTTYWTEAESWKFEGAAILQVRPRGVDDYGNEIPAFCEFHEIHLDDLAPSYREFLGALEVRLAQQQRKHTIKAREEKSAW